MAAPNLIGITSVIGKTRADLCTTSLVTILDNAINSGAVLRINAVYATNIGGADTGVSLAFFRASQTFYVALNNMVPVGTTTILMDKNNGVYLEEADALRISATAANTIQYVITYEVIS